MVGVGIFTPRFSGVGMPGSWDYFLLVVSRLFRSLDYNIDSYHCGELPIAAGTPHSPMDTCWLTDCHGWFLAC